MATFRKIESAVQVHGFYPLSVRLMDSRIESVFSFHPSRPLSNGNQRWR